MDDIAVLRLTSSRPVYRRGGVQLSNVPVDIRKGQDGGILTPEGMLALLRDPVVQMKGSADGETFTAITDAERAEIADNIEALIAARAVEVNVVTKIPDGLGPDAAADARGAADQAKAGEVKDAPAVDTKAAAAPAAGEAGSSADGKAGEGEAEKAAADAQLVKENNGGVDAAPAPVAATDAPAKANKTAKAGRGSK